MLKKKGGKFVQRWIKGLRKFRKNYQAISKLLDNNERISFGAIAKEANVSVIYLYKYHEVKKHIQEIRAEQVKEARKLTRLQSVDRYLNTGKIV